MTGLLGVLGRLIVGLRLVVTGQASSACADDSLTAPDGTVRTGLLARLIILVV